MNAGEVLGDAVLGSVFNNFHRTEIGKAPLGLPADAADGVRDSFAGALHVAEHLGGRPSAALADAAGDAFGSSTNAALLIGVAVVFVGGGVAVALLPPRSQELSDDRATRETQ
ncbi:hypothetical protein [Streptomyces sp. NPDC057199]|uniref:hypothetical protein n=1 Tax=Streptomyces sp. NPDC057199 TaxID=3346047 RepID=UPI003635DC8E